MSAKRLLLDYKLSFGTVEKVDCSKEESDWYRTLLKEGKPLPEGVYSEYAESYENAFFYKIKGCDLSKEELDEYLIYTQLNDIRTIKKCMIFFTILTIISLSISAIFVLLTLMN